MKQFKVTVVVTVDAKNLTEAEETVREVLHGPIDSSNIEITYVREVLNQSPIVKTTTIPPMDFETFSKKYTKERAKAGDHTKPEDLTAAYAAYCSDPAGHWLHKE